MDNILHNDQPITKSHQDKLNRADFVELVTNAIENCPHKQGSYVIAIDGAWGSGKTSVKNLIKEKLTKKDTKPFVAKPLKSNNQKNTSFFRKFFNKFKLTNKPSKWLLPVIWLWCFLCSIVKAPFDFLKFVQNFIRNESQISMSANKMHVNVLLHKKFFHIIEFSPLHCSDSADINKSFFKEIGIQLADKYGDLTLKKLFINVSSLYETRLSKIIIFYGLACFAYGIINTTDHFTQGKDLIRKEVVEIFVWMTAVFTLLLKETKLLMEHYFPMKTTSNTKEKLITHLKKEYQKKPVLIILDDLDKLNTKEAALIFRLLKANADLPYVVFLLLGDMAVTNKLLQQELGCIDNNYLNKFIQMQLMLPKPTPENLRNIAQNQLNDIKQNHVIQTHITSIKNYPASDSATAARENLLCSSFNTIRDIKLYINAFDFHLKCFVSNNNLEVFFWDLMLLEYIRLFHLETYNEIYKHGTACLSKEESAWQKYVKNIGSDNKNIDQMLRFLGLNPIDYGEGSAFNLSANSAKRIRNKDYFNKYFSLHTPTNETQSEFSEAYNSENRENNTHELKTA